MKSNRDFVKSSTEDTLRRASKLDPIRRSGKERHQLFKSLSDPNTDESDEDYLPERRESVLDYMDDDQE